MMNLTVRGVVKVDYDVIRRLARRWVGEAPSHLAVEKAATLPGRIGRVIYGESRENILGFLLGTVDDPVLNLTWLFAHPEYRIDGLSVLIEALAGEFKGFDIVVRIPNDEATKYEFLADLRDASGSSVTKDSSRSTKVTDERASYVYVRLRGHEIDPVGSRRNREATLGD